MKTKKIVALVLSMAMVLGVAACSKDSAETQAPAGDAATTTAAATTAGAAETTEAAPVETQEIVVDTSNYKEEEVATDVANTDDKDGELVIFGFNDEFMSRINEYSEIQIDADHYQITPNDGSAYTILLDTVLSSGEGAPDLFACDADYVKKYIVSDATVSINSLGIAYDELSEMYDYTLRFGADDNSVIKGVTWQACPCGVFYNRTVAQNTLGVSDPEDVAPFFATWDAFLDAAETVAEAGDYRIVSGWDDVFKSYLNSRKAGWVVDGKVNIDQSLVDFFDTALALYDGDLTWGTSQWSGDWTTNATNETVLSYWGPMWLGYSLGMNNGDSNPTAGDWGMVSAPTTWYWGGTWIMASKYCDKQADVAQIMRDVCIDEGTLSSINTKYGDFVNNIAYMTSVASDSTAGVEWLGGQNPFGVLLDAAKTIDNSSVGIDDASINGLFTSVVTSYVQGDIPSVSEAKTEFTNQVIAGGFANA
ncbi:MAG: hypothetical protein MJ108_07140 [Saccharofermentans sp.]|nr:hypothetical protein [Saccharofermentans sp.]